MAEQPGYRLEVPLAGSFSHGEWTVLVHGRADGVFGIGGGPEAWRVEEVKTGFGPLVPGSRRARAYALQAALYGWLLQRETGLPTEATVIWLAGGEEPERIPVRWSPVELEAQLAPIVDECLVLATRREEQRARRANAEVRAPHPTWRPGQRELADATREALEAGDHLLVDAPTGTGKTAAVLLPVAQYALAHDRRVIFATGRRTQQGLPLATLRAIAPKDLPFAVQLRSKASLCATGALWCHEDACSLAGDREGRGPAQLASLLPEGVLGADRLFQSGRDAGVCPYSLAHAASHQVPVTVCDYHHVVHPMGRLGDGTGKDPLDGAILVIDEFHQILERAREAGSATLESALVRGAAERAALGSGIRHRDTRDLCEELLAWLAELGGEAGLGELPEAEEAWLPHEAPWDPLAAFQERLAALQNAELEAGSPSDDGPGPLFEIGLALEGLLRRPTSRDDVFLLGNPSGGTALRRFEVDPAPRLAPRLGRCHTVIGLSATLEPVELHRDGLGLARERCRHLRVPSPLPSSARRVVIDPSVDTRLRARAKHADGIARRIAALAEAVPGNTMAVVPSHAFLAQMRERLAFGSHRLEAQTPGDGEAQRAWRLGQLETRDDVLLLAVAGGLYTEGVDLPGHRLLGVAVVGPCLPPPTAERRLLAAHFDERSDRGAEAAYAVPGMNSVIQAAGRVLRTPEDRGVVALLGRRFLREPYRSLLPEDWLQGGTLEERVGDPAEVARLFFAEGAP